MFENSRLLLNLKQLPRIPETLDRFITVKTFQFVGRQFGKVSDLRNFINLARIGLGVALFEWALDEFDFDVHSNRKLFGLVLWNHFVVSSYQVVVDDLLIHHIDGDGGAFSFLVVL